MEKFEKNLDVDNKFTKKDLDDLLLKITDISSADPDILSSTDKISEKCLDSKLVNSFLLDQQKFQNKDIFSYIENVIEQNPELWFFVSSSLWLGNLADKKYEDLSTNEKIKLLVLYDTLNDKTANILSLYKDGKSDKINVSKFENSYNSHMKSLFNKLSIDFKLSQLSNFWNIQKTLIQDYGLTPLEAQKFTVYLENLKEQLKNSVIEAKWAWYLFAILFGVLLWAIWMNWYYSFKYPKTETIVRTWRTELWDPKLIAKLLPVEADFTTSWSLKKSQFAVDEGDNWIFQQAKKLWNVVQTKEIVMELNWKFAVEFDLDNSIFEYDYDTKKIYAHLKSPKILITSSQANIISKNSEVFEIKSFDNAEMELLEDLKQNVVSEVSNQNIVLMKAKENAEQILTALYSQVLDNEWLELIWVEVIIDWFNNLVIPNNN